MATHSSEIFLAWKLSWAEEPGGLQSMGRKESGTMEPLTLTPTRPWLLVLRGAPPCLGPSAHKLDPDP